MFHKSQSSNSLDTKLSNTTSAALTSSLGSLDTSNFPGLNLQNRSSSSSDLNSSTSLNGITQGNHSNALSSTDAGGSMSTATKWLPLNNWYAYSESIGGSDSQDYFQINLNNRSDFSLVMSGLSADADIRLLDSSGNVICSSANAKTQGKAYTFGTSEAFNTTLNAGTYYLKVSSFDGSATDYKMDFLATPTTSTSDWYSQNLKDKGTANWARRLYSDGSLSRTDMMLLSRSAMDDSGIDANELGDLRRIINSFSMSDSVRVLSNKVFNGDPANTRSGIGNLYAGSIATQTEQLVSKWFMGTDQPTANGTYRKANGSLFQNGISHNDIRQGGVGNCYLVATLASAALEKPGVIQNMFTDNGDGTFTVKFYKNGKADYVTVDQWLPTDAYGNAIYAGWGGGNSNGSSNELWVSLAEKAYAQLNESGWIGRDNSNSYAGTEGGWMAPVMEQITGLSTSSQYASNMTKQGLINLVNSNRLLTAGFVHGEGYGVVNRHAYTITSYNSSSQTFRLHNPWGNTHADVTWEQLNSLQGIIQWTNA
ncbi:MAG: pre-peptidase C-terminal domain-containing protein [Scytonematopsis contorta HA4267-MV1]|jgi:hypothetical protein|nr:pre-peptidase C-terminal domain-containing protein [Scytonematopsis contorta HA4267-MV1]